MDISIITEQSIAAVERAVGYELNHHRFRPNLTIRSFDERQFPEDRWVGELLVFGERTDSLRIRIKRKDVRCMIVNLDPQTSLKTADILKYIVNPERTSWVFTLRPSGLGPFKLGTSYA